MDSHGCKFRQFRFKCWYCRTARQFWILELRVQNAKQNNWSTSSYNKYLHPRYPTTLVVHWCSVWNSLNLKNCLSGGDCNLLDGFWRIEACKSEWSYLNTLNLAIQPSSWKRDRWPKLALLVRPCQARYGLKPEDPLDSKRLCQSALTHLPTYIKGVVWLGCGNAATVVACCSLRPMTDQLELKIKLYFKIMSEDTQPQHTGESFPRRTGTLDKHTYHDTSYYVIYLVFPQFYTGSFWIFLKLFPLLACLLRRSAKSVRSCQTHGRRCRGSHGKRPHCMAFAGQKNIEKTVWNTW